MRIKKGCDLLFREPVRLRETGKLVYRDPESGFSENERGKDKLRFNTWSNGSGERIFLSDDEYWIVEEGEKTYVISYTTELIDNEGFIYGSLPHTEYIQAASIDSALERLKQDKDTINITYIYHD